MASNFKVSESYIVKKYYLVDYPKCFSAEPNHADVFFGYDPRLPQYDLPFLLSLYILS
jgi:hypothetical protein